MVIKHRATTFSSQRSFKRLKRVIEQTYSRINLRKPLHLGITVAIVISIAAPAIEWAASNAKYHISTAQAHVVTKPSPLLKSKLKYDKEKQSNIFNADGKSKNDPADKLTASIGGGGEKDNQLYTATLPDDPTKGIEITDNVNDVTVGFHPQFDLMDGKARSGQVSYPLKDTDGKMVFTPKANGMKEDILLLSAPKTDTADFSYKLTVPDSVEARLNDDGSVGFYSGDPQLFGNISYGSDTDRDLIATARKNAAKTYLMFSIPAPIITESKQNVGSKAMAHFTLDKTILTVHASGLTKAAYPISIDPTFLISSTQEFVLGSIDDNIDLTVAGQVGRAELGGGSLQAWVTDTLALPHCGNYSSGLVAYNGYLYSIGGGNSDCASGTTANDTTTARVYYTTVDPADGSLGASWTDTSSLLTARQGLVAFGYNGYLYAVGGEADSGTPITAASSVEFAQINSTGGVGTWNYTGHLTNARGYLGGALYQGILYAMGGEGAANNASLSTSVEYAQINGDGTIGTCGTGTFNSGCTWTATTALGTARNRLSAVAYNGFVYVLGGRTGTPAVVATVEYAPVNDDGSLGAWITGTSFPTARRDAGVGADRGHIYIYGGCSVTTFACTAFQDDTEYAVINADGSIGNWQHTASYVTGSAPARSMPSSTFYNGYLYFVGGCTVEVAASNDCTTTGAAPGPGVRSGVFHATFSDVGRFDDGTAGTQTTPPFNNNAIATPRYGAAVIALNGYMYYISGATQTGTSTLYSATTEYAPINANGVLGTWGVTASLIGASGNFAGRIGASVAAYNNKIYVIGGVEMKNPATNGNQYMTNVLSSTQATNGTLGTFAAETNVLPAARAFSTSVQWHNFIYVLGGLQDDTTVTGTVYRSQIQTNGTLGTWSATTTGITARWGASGGIWGNWIYVISGMTAGATTYIGNTAALHAVQKLTIDNDGNITTAAVDYASNTARRMNAGFVHNGYIYTFGGENTGSTNATRNIYWTALNATTGAPGTFVNTDIGNYPGQTQGLSTVRTQPGGVSYGGYIYIIGGCSGTIPVTSSGWDTCSALVSAAQNVEVYQPNNGGVGQTNAFSTITALSAARADHSSVAYNGKLYVLGGCTAYTAGACTTNVTTVQSTDIQPNGTLAGSWTTETALPSARSLGQALAYNGFMYYLGGRTSAAGASLTVWRVPIANTGTLGTWIDLSGEYMPATTDRRNFGAAISRGYLYAFGGESAAGVYKADVYYAPIDNDGSIGTWNSTTSFTTARSGFGFTNYNGVLYVGGGYNGANLTDTQYAVLNSNGTITAWKYTTDMPRGAVGRQMAALNGYLYFIGNEGTTAEITYADINANGTLGSLQSSPNDMAAAHAHGSAAIYNGRLFVTGGCVLSGINCTTVSTANEGAGQQAISRTGHYSKLFDTQVDTSPTQLVINGTTSGPGSAVELQFQSASSADPVLGVAQLIRPVVFGTFYTVQPLNSSGTNVGVAFRYYIRLALDDSRSGTFPDVNQSGSQTAVTDLLMYYHANPSRRLRHGASFTNTGCNPTPAQGCILDTAQ